MKERERPREQSERVREREVERERFAARAIPERISPVCLDWELTLCSASCENSVVEHKWFVLREVWQIKCEVSYSTAQGTPQQEHSTVNWVRGSGLWRAIGTAWGELKRSARKRCLYQVPAPGRPPAPTREPFLVPQNNHGTVCIRQLWKNLYDAFVPSVPASQGGWILKDRIF